MTTPRTSCWRTTSALAAPARPSTSAAATALCPTPRPARLPHDRHRLLPTAIALAAAQDPGSDIVPVWQRMDITTDDLGTLPEPAYAAITCRLVYRWIDDKAAFLNRVRHLLAPGGTFWVVTEIAGHRHATDPLQNLGITPAQAELLTAGWSAVHTADLDVLRCYALCP
ncbi:class I SAM-dependent methyltransferase [Streptomyces tricolor]|nr:class I SAM-dependent methyltransferase [Streptomyces tricolor]